MPQKSTERYRLTIGVTSVRAIHACVEMLSSRRMVSHTPSDIIAIAIESVTKAVPWQVKMMARFGFAERQKITLKVRKEVKDQVRALAKKHNVTLTVIMDVVMTIYFKAAVVALWKERNPKYIGIIQRNKDIMVRSSTGPMNIKRTKEVHSKKRKLTLQKDQNEMRHHKYLEEFKQHMEAYGGIDKYVGTKIHANIHARPIEGSFGLTTELDLPEDQNPSTLYTFNLWKRGRGYNITIIGGPHNDNEGAPVLEAGTVLRLYDIYRNINWRTANPYQQ